MTTKTPTQNKPTIVLVHGAFADSSSWNGVVTELLAGGFPVVAAANPLRSVKGDAAYVASIVKGVRGPVVLVGHSYGGSVITNAVEGNSNVKALVFVAGFAPDQGETSAELAARFPGSTLGATLAPPVELPSGDKDLYIQQDKYRAQFAADVPPETARVLAATQRPVTAAALNERSAAPAWKALPSWFVYGDSDKNIPAAVHAFMAERARSKETIAVAGASHAFMVISPAVVAGIITRAASAT